MRLCNPLNPLSTVITAARTKLMLLPNIGFEPASISDIDAEATQMATYLLQAISMSTRAEYNLPSQVTKKQMNLLRILCEGRSFIRRIGE